MQGVSGSSPLAPTSGQPPLPSRDHHFCDGRDFSCLRFCAAPVLPGSEEAWTQVAFQSQAFSFALQLAFTAGIPFVTPTPAASCRSRAAWGDFLSSQRAANKSHRTAARWLLFGRYSRSFRVDQAAFSPSARAGVPVKPSARTCVSVLHKRGPQPPLQGAN